eukprot:scaffold2616_cov88-Amphora_coffeaeformis.AAC.1
MDKGPEIQLKDYSYQNSAAINKTSTGAQAHPKHAFRAQLDIVYSTTSRNLFADCLKPYGAFKRTGIARRHLPGMKLPQQD